MDGTYKLNHPGLSVLVFGFVDADQVFHLCAIAVCLRECEEDFAWSFEKLEEAVETVSPGYLARRKEQHVITMQDGAMAIRNGQAVIEAFFATLYRCSPRHLAQSTPVLRISSTA